MASRNETTPEIYPKFSDCAIWHFLFQRQFYQSDGSQQQLPYQQSSRGVSQAYLFHRTPLVVASKREIQAPTFTARREQEEEFRGSPDNQNTYEEEENSTKQTNSKSPEDELDIELFVGLVRQFPVTWNTRLNGFKDYNNKKVTWNNISTSL